MHECFDPGDVGGAIVAYAYFSLFVILGQFMMLNLFVAVILENFEREMDVSTVAKVSYTSKQGRRERGQTYTSNSPSPRSLPLYSPPR